MHVFLYFPVPATVHRLAVENVYNSYLLMASWQSAPGIADRYDLLLLTDKGVLINNKSVPANTKSYKFEELVPGKMYKIRVFTVSGGLFSTAEETAGRTGKQMFGKGYRLHLQT